MNFEQLYNKMLEQFPNHKEASMKRWIASSKKVMKECYKVDSFDEFYYENIRDYKQYVYSFDDKCARKNLSCGMYKSVLSIKSDLAIVFEKFYKKCSSEYESERRYRPANKKEITQHKTFEELVDIRYELFEKRDKSKNDFMKYYVAALYTKCPPVRQEEWLSAFIDVEDTGDNNFIDTKKKIFFIRNYKTQKTYGKREIPLDTGLVVTIKKYKKLFNTDLAICKVSDNKKAMSSAGFSQYLKNIFGCSVCMLRKIYISEKVVDNDDITMQERNKIARYMAHSVTTQQSIYSRFSKRLQ